MADNRIAYGMLKKAGVDTEGMSPKEAWEKVEELGLAPSISKYGKKKYKKSKEAKKENPEHTADFDYIPKTGDEIAGVMPGEPMTFEQADGKRVNPYYGNPEFEGYEKNCPVCVVAFEARVRGYNVRALPYSEKNHRMKELEKQTNLVFLNKETSEPPEYIISPKNVNPHKFVTDLMREGQRYTIEWTWKDEIDEGHVINAFKKNGKSVFFNSQSGEIISNSEFKSMCETSIEGPLEVLRVDNCDLNPMYINYIVKGVKSGGK